MSDESKSIDVLEAQISALSDTHTNLVGLVEKTSRIQSDLLSGGFQEFSDAAGESFSAISTAAEKLQELLHSLELERNRIRNEE